MSALYAGFVRGVAAQWVSIVLLLIVVTTGPGTPLGTALALLPAVAFVVALVVTPNIGARLAARVGDARVGDAAAVLSLPLFSLLAVFGLRAGVDRWRRLHGVEP